ncbi:glucan biosynthesis protein G [Ramlibacter sp.]|uniref:glucan biosynthesis protein G n=1 Tax=Ramlibacter sp. TaxID=1917967 RepID=UPI002D180679|nr:glucan biosynthesis protein G [Ramlibacter sp.]HWI80605.1 glucan biosynthesis protein G [Ramlibacter sp.]
MRFVPAAARALRRAVVLLACAAGAAAAERAPFDFESVARLARARLQEPYQAPARTLPPDLQALDYDGVRDIRFRPPRALWRDANLPFEAMFFHLGLYQREPVRIHEISAAGPRPLPYNRADFDFGRNRLRPESWGDLGFAGLRLHYPLNTPAYKDELVAFLGASYFRALGAGQQYGLSARGLAIDASGGAGEEFPRFTEFWLQRPAADARQVTLFALLDSPRATGAYQFEIVPGPQTVTRVRARLFLRPGAPRPIATLGVAPLTSMFFFGENQPRRSDFRPEVHDSDGLLVEGGDGEWIWRPLQNPARPIATSFALNGLRGFGLMQRDRAFASYEDLEARYERRPSAWVRPLGDWGAGRVELLQLPTPDETHDNVVAYWVPAKLPAPGEPLDLAYEIAWQGDAQQRPPGSWVTQSRRGFGYSRLEPQALAQQVQYVLDFKGPALDALPAAAPVRAVVSADANGRVLEQVAYRNPASDSWRMTLRVQRIDPAQPVEVRAFLQLDNHILSETWSNIILPE